MRKLALLISSVFFILLSVELVLSFFGKSLCTHSSCLAVDALTLSHKLVVSMGVLYFGLYFLLAFFKKRDLFLLGICGISAELIFILRQALEYHIFCPFCLLVAAGVILCSILSFVLEPMRLEVAEASFFTLISVALVFTLTRVPLTPLKQNRVLIYSPSCPHCERVLEYCKEKGIRLSLCRETNVKGLLYCLGLKGVPALLIKEGGEIRIVQGEENVISYLSAGTQAGMSGESFSLPFKNSGVCTERGCNWCELQKF